MNHPDIVRNGGIEPSDSNPHFHQQMVYAVISHLLRTFDRALGRQMRFRAAKTGDVSRLTVRPHGMTDANAYYDPETVELAFGQFNAGENSTGRNIPGQPVYTCLSHGILVHETTHALLDGLRPSYMLATSAHSMAFHEGFCDIVAFLQQLTFQDAMLDTIQRTGGRLYSASLQPELEGVAGAGEDRNPLILLGQQFGQAIGMGDALRSAVGAPPGKDALESDTTAAAGPGHGDRGLRGVLSRVRAPHAQPVSPLGAVTVRTTGTCIRIWRGGWPPKPRNWPTAFLQLCIRAIAYCPAVDIALGDYLRALMTVHTRLDPDDRDGLRDALIDAFSRRSIYPPDVDSMSESELIWKRPGGSLTVEREVVRALRAADAQGQQDIERGAGAAGVLRSEPRGAGLHSGRAARDQPLPPGDTVRGCRARRRRGARVPGDPDRQIDRKEEALDPGSSTAGRRSYSPMTGGTDDCATRSRSASMSGGSATRSPGSRRDSRAKRGRRRRSGSRVERLQLAEQRRHELRHGRMDVHGPLDQRIWRLRIHHVEDRVHHLVAAGAQDGGAENLAGLARRRRPS